MDVFTLKSSSDRHKWIIFSPRRAKRPDVSIHAESLCPFCPGEVDEGREVYRIGGEKQDNNWLVRVLNNKYPFAEVHEIIIHSQDHHKNIDELPISQVRILLEVYKQRYDLHKSKGHVILFHNRGVQAGESLPHPHTQLVVIPEAIPIDVGHSMKISDEAVATQNFAVFSPEFAQWPDEVCIRPLLIKDFSQASEAVLDELANILPRTIRLLDHRHGHEFPFNFIFQFEPLWSIRIIPRQKILGGFELGTEVFVNTQDPNETNAFLQKHWNDTDIYMSAEENASYPTAV